MIFSSRELRATGIVAGLSAGFGILLLQGTSVLSDVILANQIAQHDSVRLALLVVAFVFFAIALFVGAIVTSNTVATVIAGAVRDIARLRLLGATADRLRRSIASRGLIASTTGALFGAVAVGVLDQVIVSAAAAAGLLSSASAPPVTAALVVPVFCTIAVSLASVWSGSRRILAVSPVEASAQTGEPTQSDPTRRRPHAGATLVIVGAALLAFGILLGLLSPFGILVAMLGGMVSFCGVIALAERIMPPALSLIGRALSIGHASRLAAANAVRNPVRASRTTIGMVVGVTLVTMFWVAMQTYIDVIVGAQSAHPELYAGASEAVTVTVSIFSALLGFSAVIAAVGLVSTL